MRDDLFVDRFDFDDVNFFRAQRKLRNVHVKVGPDTYALCGVSTRSMVWNSAWVVLERLGTAMWQVPSDKRGQNRMACERATCGACVAEFTRLRLLNCLPDRDLAKIDEEHINCIARRLLARSDID